MRRLSAWLALLLLAFLLPAPVRAQAESAYTTAVTRVRAAPSAEARVLATVPRAREVRVSRCASGWCRVRYGSVAGYASQRLLGEARPAAARPSEGRGYVNSRGERVRSPVRSVDGRVPAGASARCRDGTYSFSRSRRGTCSRHGGVEAWL